MLRSAATNARELEDSNATGVDSWERFCREEARQAACSFLERVKRFKSRNASARDVHDSTFTNEFSAAFLEESSVLMASGDTQLQASCGAVPRMNGQSQSHGFSLNRSASTRAGAGAGGNGGRTAFVRQESKASVKNNGGKKAWWSNIFKWSKSKRDRRNNGRPGLSSSGEYLSPSSSRSNSSSTTNQSGSRRRVILDGQVQLLDLNETEGPLQWTQCKLVLAEAQGHHQVEIFMPPKSSVPRTTLFCFLIEDVRSTSALEIPDSTTCFVIKSQNHGEHVFKADTESKKQHWIQAILDCKSQIIRSASAQTHLATLPRTPQRTPVRLPNGSSSNRGGGVSLDASPAMHCCSGVGGAGGVAGGRGSGPRYASYASSDSSEQKKSTLNVGAESDGEDSMMDVTSLIRRFHHASPSRRRKVQSMFIDSSNLHSVHPTTAMATMMTSSHYQPPPLLSYSPPNYEEDYLHHHPHHHQPPSLPARLPFTSLPTDCSNLTSISAAPPPLPKRNPPARNASTSVSCSSSRESQHHHRTSPSHMTHLVSSTATSTTTPPPLPPMSTARLTAISTTNDVTSTSVNGCNSTNGTSSSARIQASPRRKYSQSFVDIPPTIHSGSSQGNLELCSQSSSSSALHPVSLAAVQRSMATNNGRRRSSITSNPGDSTTTAGAQPMSLMNLQAFPSKPSERVRKVSAPVLIAGDQIVKQLSLVGEGEVESALQKKVVGNGAAPGQKNINDSSDNLNDLAKEASPVPESDRELEDEEKTVVEGDGEGERERKEEGEGEEEETGRGKEREKTELGESEQPPSSTSTAGDGSRGDGSGVAELAVSPVQRRQQQEECNGAIENGINDEATSRKATFTFPFSSSSQTNQGSNTNSGYSPPVPPRTSSPLLIHQRSESRGRSGSPLTPDLVATNHLSYNVRSPHPPSQQENEESESGGLMVGTLVAGTGMGSSPLLGTVGGGSGRMMGGVSERRGHRRGHSLISSHSIQTDPSTRTNSSSSDGTESNPANSSSAPGISNPIYVETTEGERAQVSQQVELHTQHPYEHWATSQQDVANLRLLSRYPWFHGMVSRANASQLVLAEGENGTGQYLVRQSESREGDFVLTFNYHNRAKHLRMAVDEGGCNIQHLWFDDVPSMLDYFKTNSIPLESFWLNDDVKLTTYIDRQASDSFRTTTIVNVDRLARVPPRRSRSLHLSTANSVNSAATTSANSSNPETPLPLPLDANASSASSSNSQSTNSLPQSARNSTGWRLFRSQRSSSAGNVGRVQRRHSANVGSLLNTGMNSNRSSGRRRRSNNENNYLVRNY